MPETGRTIFCFYTLRAAETGGPLGGAPIVACRKGNRSEPALAGYQHFGGGSDELLLLGATERIGPVFALLHAMAQGRASPPRQISSRTFDFSQTGHHRRAFAGRPRLPSD